MNNKMILEGTQTKDLQKLLSTAEKFLSKDTTREVLTYANVIDDKTYFADGCRMIEIDSNFGLENGSYELFKKKNKMTLVKIEKEFTLLFLKEISRKDFDHYADIEITSKLNIAELQYLTHKQIGIEELSFLDPENFEPLIGLDVTWSLQSQNSVGIPIQLNGSFSGIKIRMCSMMIRPRR